MRIAKDILGALWFLFVIVYTGYAVWRAIDDFTAYHCIIASLYIALFLMYVIRLGVRSGTEDPVVSVHIGKGIKAHVAEDPDGR